MGNIIALGRETAKCPVGSKAIHREHGWCEVVGAQGLQRTIEVERRETDPTPMPILEEGDQHILPGELVYSEKIWTEEFVVDVRTLRPACASR